jgi:selenocysteine lyase/cysteine desulfurase
LKNQKHLFTLPKDIHYLNCAYMGPQLKTVEQAGIEAILKKNNPTQIKPKHFFEEAGVLKQNFAKIINASSERIAIVPSASYGLMTAVNNLPLGNGNEALVVGEEFPSGYFSIVRWCEKHQKQLKTIPRPSHSPQVGREWHEQLIDSITDQTAVLLMSTVHWTDGTKFLLEEIGQKCKEHKVVFILDGTQSVGAIPIDVQKIQADALICAGYKWLLGPYSLGLAYYSEIFNNGIPLEESWMNRSNSEEFSSLTKYDPLYSEGAGRYNMGEFSSFILLPMLNKALEQILDWGVENIESYTKKLAEPLFPFLKEKGYGFEEEDFRSGHIFGIHLPATMDKESLLADLEKSKIYVSVRGEAIRLSLHLFNTLEDLEALMDVLDRPSK